MLDEDEEPDRIRDSEAVARRSIVLYSVVARACGAEREDILAWLAANGLIADLSPEERAFMAATEPSERAIINFSWHSERLIVLLWALGLADMPEPDDQ